MPEPKPGSARCYTPVQPDGGENAALLPVDGVGIGDTAREIVGDTGQAAAGGMEVGSFWGMDSGDGGEAIWLAICCCIVTLPISCLGFALKHLIEDFETSPRGASMRLLFALGMTAASTVVMCLYLTPYLFGNLKANNEQASHDQGTEPLSDVTLLTIAYLITSVLNCVICPTLVNLFHFCPRVRPDDVEGSRRLLAEHRLRDSDNPNYYGTSERLPGTAHQV